MGEHFRTTRRKEIVGRALMQGQQGHWWDFTLVCGHHVRRLSTPSSDKQRWAMCWNCPPTVSGGSPLAAARVLGGS